MKTVLLAAISILLAVFSPGVFADGPSWATPSDIQFQNIPVSDRIIPLGFSKKGIFSYILQQNSCFGPTSGNQKVSWIAVDLISDEIIDDIDLGEESSGITAEDVLQKNEKTIGDYNSQYGITVTYSDAIATTPVIRLVNDVLTIQTELIETVDGEDAVNPGYRIYRSSLSSEARGTKALSEIKSIYEPLRYWGYLKSPYEERTVAFFISDFRGCDAFPQMHINVIGANLVHGFGAETKE